jgi:hypothetical protein
MRSLLENEPRPSEIEIPPDGISLDLLRAVYRNSSIPLSVRIRAAGLAIPYDTPRLMVTAQVNENNFAELLDRRLRRMEEAKLIEHQPQVETKPLKPRLSDRRYRRL